MSYLLSYLASLEGRLFFSSTRNSYLLPSSSAFHKSHISDPQRLAQLMIAACLAYIWIIYLGNLSKKQRWDKIIHRTDRCDLSLFQMGLRLSERNHHTVGQGDGDSGKRDPVNRNVS